MTAGTIRYPYAIEPRTLYPGSSSLINIIFRSVIDFIECMGAVSSAYRLHVVATTMVSSIKTQIIGYGEPVRTTTNVFLRPPHIIISDGAQLEIFRIGGSINPRPGYGVPRFKHLSQHVMKEFEIHKEALKGRGVNVVHGCDLQDGTLACGTATGLVLAFDPCKWDISDGPPVTSTR